MSISSFIRKFASLTHLPIHSPNLKVKAASPGHVKTAVSVDSMRMVLGSTIDFIPQFNDYLGKLTVEQSASVYVHLATLPNDGPSELPFLVLYSSSN